jgi:galactose mutarotase-like enzyme
MDMKNDFLSIQVTDKGAELTNITDVKTGFEFLWQADPAVWGRHAPILFPIVGKVKNNVLCVDGKEYVMNQHGFARDKAFTRITETENEVWYELNSSEETLMVYPYSFTLRLGYTLNKNTLTCSYHIINTGAQTMYFSIGAHPGFNLPLAGLDEYTIEFEKEENEERHLLDGGLFNHTHKPVLSSPTTIELTSKLFDDDAIVFKDLHSKQLKLKQRNGTFCITLDYEGFPHMGIWTQKGNEQYLCLEPWCGHADSVNGHSNISTKEGIITLLPHTEFKRSYSLSFEV